MGQVQFRCKPSSNTLYFSYYTGVWISKYLTKTWVFHIWSISSPKLQRGAYINVSRRSTHLTCGQQTAVPTCPVCSSTFWTPGGRHSHMSHDKHNVLLTLTGGVSLSNIVTVIQQLELKNNGSPIAELKLLLLNANPKLTLKNTQNQNSLLSLHNVGGTLGAWLGWKL